MQGRARCHPQEVTLSSTWPVKQRQKITIPSNQPIKYPQEVTVSINWSTIRNWKLCGQLFSWWELDVGFFIVVEIFSTKVSEDFRWFTGILFCRCASPPECEQSLPQPRHQEQSVGQREAGRREGSCTLTPMMRALIELEETRATESRAPCKNSSATHSMTHTHSQDGTNLINAQI